MKAKDLRNSSDEQLQQQLEDLLKEQFMLRMQQGTGQLSRPSQMRAVRRDIARVKTIIGEAKASSGK
jgi:large subunit ribosomal protein L29